MLEALSSLGSSPRMETLSPFWASLPVPEHPWEEFFFFPLKHSQNPPCHSLCPSPLLLGGASEKSLPVCCPQPHTWLLRVMIGFPFSRLTNPRHLRLFSPITCFSPPATSAVLCWTHCSFPVVFLYWEAQNWTQYSQNGLTSAVKHRITTSLNLSATLLLMQSSTQAASTPTMMHY